ncbi:hypothetical protein B6U91_02255 [Candidatus Pacearchaeota archaeon ex4484_71]|nr:MAG: hypothetical protein B6U91_02255 [Candidatus Pacearchaeota archaeon ex4484_71]
MFDGETKNLLTIIVLVALVMGLFLGLAAKSLRGEKDVFVFEHVEKLCNPLGTGNNGYSTCDVVLVGGILISFIVGTLEIMRLKGELGKYNIGVVSYISGSIMGFIITSSL